MAVFRLFLALLLALGVLAAKRDPVNRPVSQVITVLQDMLKDLEADQKEDEDIYDKMACWCETNDKEKTQAIADAEAHITDLNSDIEELTATSARLGAELEALDKEVAANKRSLEEATAIRKKQNEEYNEAEKDLIEAIEALKAAIVVLSKHHDGAFLQEPSTTMLSTATMLQEQLRRNARLLKGVLKPSQRKALQAFVQSQLGQEPGHLGSSPTFKQAYAPQSGEIYGILRQMLETFESNLSDEQKAELKASETYKDMKAAKQEELKAGEEQIEAKTVQRADADEAKVQAKQDLEDTKRSLSADEQYLMTLKEKCQLTDKEWEERQKTRQEEMVAISKTLHVLSSDDAHDLFTRTFNPTFLQTSVSRNVGARERAAALLSGIAHKVSSQEMTTLATKVQLDDFTKVKEAIDRMVDELTKEKDDEIKHKDYCVGELNTNELQTEEKERQKEDELTHIAALESTIESLGAEIDALHTEVSDIQVDMKRAGEDREAQNKEFQTTVADQKETQKLLEQARQFLVSHYAKAAAAASLAQKKQEPVGPPPPPGFDDYEAHEGAAGVIGMIQQIIDDAKKLESDAVRAEEEAQKAYEDLVKESNDSITAKSRSIADKTNDKAEAEGELVQAKSDSESTMKELEHLSSYSAEVHSSCDFILKNFEVRQTARDEEIEALRQAKAILSGSDFGDE